MATQDNYISELHGLSTVDRSKLLMQRIREVIEGSELLRKECNRIRNEMNNLGVTPDLELSGLLSHLLLDLVSLRVKFAYMSGLKGDEMTALIRQLENPFVRGSNEDPA